MTMSVPAISRRPSVAETLRTLAFAMLLSMLVDSVLIVAGFAVASNFVENLSGDAGIVCVIIMAVSLVIIWPVVLIPLIVLLFAGDIVRRMPAWVFIVCFSATVTASFTIFLYGVVGDTRLGLADFLQNATVLVDAGIAWLVSSTFAILYRTLSAHRRL